LKKKILVISGGFSKEREISIQTGIQVARELKKNGYTVKVCEPDNEIYKIVEKFKPNKIFNALHGQFGEDGYFQTILENIGIPYTHSGVEASVKAMDKEVSKKLFIKNKILTPKYIKFDFDRPYSKLQNQIENSFGFPVVIKPIAEGSSVDVFICNKLNFKKKIKLLENYKKILIEEFIPGREIQAAILGEKKLGAIELKPKRKFYDYKAKYDSKAKTEHIIPVDIDKKDLNILMNISFRAHNLLGCRGVTRSDFKFFNNKFYLLEINTQPGMTKLSLVPEICAHKGISFIKLIELLLNDASTNK
jgi:D-alanine-D-alanine ligase